ncbi:MAG: hypothetical protein RJA99_1628 [Pseudomonadota bacterium]
MARRDLPAALLGPGEAAPACEAADDWLRAWRAAQSDAADAHPFDAAVLAATRADRVAWAFFCGYQGALQAAFGAAPGAPAAFCANESGRRITEIGTALRRDGEVLRLDGHKSWALVPSTDTVLLVLARAVDGPASGPGSLAVVRVPLAAPGVVRETGSPQRVVPELPHAALRLEAVPVAAADVLRGDGYADHAKPFGLVENLFIHACVLASLLVEARAADWPLAWCERAVAAIALLGDCARRDARSAGTAVLAAGALAFADAVVDEVGALWTPTRSAARGRWLRDAALLALGQAARRQRTRTAWTAFGRAPDAVPATGPATPGPPARP